MPLRLQVLTLERMLLGDHDTSEMLHYFKWKYNVVIVKIFHKIILDIVCSGDY